MEVNYKEVNDFIEKVFNYYNGKINILNPNVILEINWINGDYLGEFIQPNFLMIYPYKILEICNTIDYIKLRIIEIIIHELFHADQLLFNIYYKKDNNEYENNIENAVQRQTSIYIASHIIEIKNIFGINKTPEFDTLYNHIYDFDYAAYIKNDCITHILHLLETLTDRSTVSDIAEIYLSEIDLRIILYINNNSIILVDNDYICDITTFNNFINKFIPNSYCQISDIYEMKRNNNDLIIRINIKIVNELCNIIK